MQAQVTFIILSSQDQHPLPYASIVNHSKNRLIFTNEQGVVNAPFDNGDSVSISYVGYESIRLRIHAQQHYQYTLRQRDDLMKPVIFHPCKNYGSSDYSDLTTENSGREFGGVSWHKQTMNARVAVMLKPPVDQGYLESFSCWLKRQPPAPKIAIKAPIKFSFYSVRDTDGLPGELLSEKQIIYHPQKEGKQTIELDSIHLRIPGNGLYVSIEYILLEPYEWPLRIIDPVNGIDSVATGYGVMLDGVYAKDFLLAFYRYQDESWFFPGNEDKTLADKLHGTIKCAARIKYCVE
jgi:hypothetical protein